MAPIQGLTPNRMQGTVCGFGIAIGRVVVGAISDRMSAADSTHVLTAVLLATDLLAISTTICCAPHVPCQPSVECLAQAQHPGEAA